LNESTEPNLQWVRLNSKKWRKTSAKCDIEDVDMRGETVVLDSNMIISPKCHTPDGHWWIEM